MIVNGKKIKTHDRDKLKRGRENNGVDEGMDESVQKRLEARSTCGGEREQH